MEETHTCGCESCGCDNQQEESVESTATCTSGSCDVDFAFSEDARFATLLMLVPTLTLSAFNMMGLL